MKILLLIILMWIPNVVGDIPNLGLLIAANIIPDISYKYMYGLNIVLIKVN